MTFNSSGAVIGWIEAYRGIASIVQHPTAPPHLELCPAWSIDETSKRPAVPSKLHLVYGWQGLGSPKPKWRLLHITLYNTYVMDNTSPCARKGMECYVLSTCCLWLESSVSNMSLKRLSQSWIVVGRQYSNKSSKKTAFSFLVSVPHGDIVQIWHSCRSNLCKLRLGFARFPTKQNASRSKYLIPADRPRCVCSPNTQPRDHFGVKPLASRQYHVFRLCRSYHLIHHTIYWILFAACDMPNACHNRGHQLEISRFTSFSEPWQTGYEADQV